MMSIIDSGLIKYEEALRAGMSRDEAKQYAYLSVPGLKAGVARREVLTHWGNGIKAVDKKLGIGNGSGPQRRKVNPNATLPISDDINNGKRQESFVRTSSGRISIVETFLAFMISKKPKIGDEIDLGNLELWGWAMGVTPTGITMPFRHYETHARPVSAMENEGWFFEIVNPSYRCFTVRVVGVPPEPEPEPVIPEPSPPPAERTYTAAEVQQLFAEFLAAKK